MNSTNQSEGVKKPAPATLKRGGLLQRKCDCGQHTVAGGACASCSKHTDHSLQRSAINHEPDRSNDNEIPSIVHEVLGSAGHSLDPAMRAFMEPRFGHDFSQVRVHFDSKAGESARAVGALAYTVGRDIAFGPGTYEPGRGTGMHLLAHELTHVVQQQGGPGGSAVQKAQGIEKEDSGPEQEAEQVANLIVSGASPLAVPTMSRTPSSPATMQRYRSKSSFNFGRRDTATLIEESFKDSKTQPWVEQITLKFDGTTIDSNGDLIPTGTLTATYKNNSAALSDITLSVVGGSVNIGLSDKGTGFTISRIEGVGYNDKPLSAAEGEGPNRKYAKSLTSSMSYAMFFSGKQAIHIGDLNLGSHACVHAGTNTAAWDKMQQLNYHSVVGRTKVDVSYDATALKSLCCGRMKHLGTKKKGDAPNPCNNADPKACPP